MPRYSKLMITLHWITALLFLGAWFTSEGGRHARENPSLLHFSLGLTVLILVLPRLIVRLAFGAPALEDRRVAGSTSRPKSATQSSIFS